MTCSTMPGSNLYSSLSKFTFSCDRGLTALGSKSSGSSGVLACSRITQAPRATSDRVMVSHCGTGEEQLCIFSIRERNKNLLLNIPCIVASFRSFLQSDDRDRAKET